MKYGREILQDVYGRLMTINIRRFVDYSLLVLFIAASGVPYISDPKINVLLFILLSATFFYRRRSFNAYFLLFLSILLMITLLQALKFDFISLVTTIGLFTLVLNAYFMVKVLEDKFIDYFITVMYYISIISLVFVITFFILPALGHFVYYSIVPLFSVFNLAGSVHKTVLVYNLSHIESFRNSGPFWEPGAYAGYLLIAFMFSFVKEQAHFTKQNIILLITLLTTFSTTGFFGLFLFLFFVYYKKFKNILIKAIVAVTLVSLGVFAYFTFDFLGKKIEDQIAKETSQKEFYNVRNTGRFVTMIRDMKDLEGHEWVGRGGNFTTRFDNAGGKIILRSVGLTDVIVKYGIPFFILMLYFLGRSICRTLSAISMQKADRLICTGMFIAMIALLISEVYFNYSMYWSLLFLMFVYYPSNQLNQRSQI